MIALALVGGFFMAGIIGAVFYPDRAVRVEWAVASVICFLGVAYDRNIEATKATTAAPIPNMGVGDLLAQRVSLKSMKRLADDIREAEQREVRSRGEVRRGDQWGGGETGTTGQYLDSSVRSP